MKPAGVLSVNNNDVKNQDILKYQQTVQLDIKKVVLPIRLIIDNQRCHGHWSNGYLDKKDEKSSKSKSNNAINCMDSYQPVSRKF